MTANAFKDIGIQLVGGAINHNDVPGAVVSSVEQAFTLFDKIDSDNVAVQYDLYHSVRAGEDLFAVLAANMDLIAHIQVSDVPGRHQPGGGF